MLKTLLMVLRGTCVRPLPPPTFLWSLQLIQLVDLCSLQLLVLIKKVLVSDSKGHCVVVMLIECIARGDLASLSVMLIHLLSLPAGDESSGDFLFSALALRTYHLVWSERGMGGGAQESAFSFLFLKLPMLSLCGSYMVVCGTLFDIHTSVNVSIILFISVVFIGHSRVYTC